MEVLSRRMPPWSAAKGFGDFRNDRSLTPVEIELIASWVDGATPVGPAVSCRSSDATTAGRCLIWSLSCRLTSHRAWSTYAYRPTERHDRWLTAWQFLPGDRTLVERATISIVSGVSVGTWTPSDGITQFGPGIAQRLPGGATLAIELRYRKTSGSHDASEPIQSRGHVALYFSGQTQASTPTSHAAVRCAPRAQRSRYPRSNAPTSPAQGATSKSSRGARTRSLNRSRLYADTNRLLRRRIGCARLFRYLVTAASKFGRATLAVVPISGSCADSVAAPPTHPRLEIWREGFTAHRAPGR